MEDHKRTSPLKFWASSTSKNLKPIGWAEWISTPEGNQKRNGATTTMEDHKRTSPLKFWASSRSKNLKTIGWAEWISTPEGTQKRNQKKNGKGN